ncbi:MAG TPA: tetratricopeptide repeat protein [Chloroflexota bacterium]|nr:tetratricopeptide repeat protein [Chloroflexota bacterium]
MVSDSEASAPLRAASFGDLLRHFRRRAGLTQEELAERATLSVRAISDLERGAKQGPHRTTVELLASALALSGEERNQLESSARRKRGPWRAAGSGRRPSPLPEPLTPLVGRDRDVIDAVHRLRWGGVRLLSLTGPGGVGKTRVAIAIAHALQEDCAGGPTYVSLAPIRDARLVATSIVASLGLEDARGHGDEEILITHLQGRESILVLDNFEHVLEASTLVARLLRECPRLKLIVTSRVALKLQGEQRLTIAPLEVPASGDLAALEPAARYPAMQLFVQRAGSVRHDFALTDANLATVVEICRRLDGLPLAIELAAARVAHLSPSALLLRLSGRLLTDGPTDLPARQQTMAGTIAWSYDLLPESERRLLRRLSVFAGGWSLEAADAIAGEDGAGTHALFAGLSRLVDASLIVSDDGAEDEPRYRMLEVIREYAAERLTESGEEERMRAAHAAFFSELAVRAEPEFWGVREKAWLARLQRDNANVRVALSWYLQRGDGPAGLRLAAALGIFWHDSGQLTEGRHWFESLLAADAGTAIAERAKALDRLGMLVRAQGDFDHARRLLEESLCLYREIGDQWTAAIVLTHLGGLAGMMGELERAEQLLAESLTLHRRLGNRGYAASALDRLGEVRLRQGDLARARELLDEAHAMHQEVGDLVGAAESLLALGRIEQRQRDHARARAFYRDALTLLGRIGAVGRMPDVVEALATLLSDGGDGSQAARLWGVSAAIRDAIGRPAATAGPSRLEPPPTSPHTGLTEEAWRAAWQQGYAVSLEDAVEYVLAESEWQSESTDGRPPNHRFSPPL